MKKSEALYLIADAIDHFGGRSSFEMAQVILIKLERIGMKPPSYTEDSECIGSQVENEWESEYEEE
jgi:hypothetical protein